MLFDDEDGTSKEEECPKIGVLDSSGRVSIKPVIVSAGPTMSSSRRHRVFEPGEVAPPDTAAASAEDDDVDDEIRCTLSSSTIVSKFFDWLCRGIGGAVVLGTSISTDVIFSELLLKFEACKRAPMFKFIKLEADETFCVDRCGILLFVEVEEEFDADDDDEDEDCELSTPGDDFRGGSGGATTVPDKEDEFECVEC